MTTTKTRRWSKVLGEFILILAGVLTALAVDQWRESRRDRRLEREYLVRLRADLVETRQSIDNTTTDFERLLVHGRAVSRVLDGENAFPADTLGFLASALHVSRGGYDPAVARGAYDDLISTGNIRLLRNEALRYRLSTFYGTVDNDLSPIDYSADKMPYRNTIRSLLSLDTQLHIRAHCGDEAALSCPDAAGAHGFGAMVAAIMESPRIRPELTVALQGMAIRSLQAGVTGGFTPVLHKIDELLSMLPEDAR